MEGTLIDPVANFARDNAWIVVFASQDDLARAAASEAAQIIARAIRQNGRARIIVGTGNSQDRMIHSLTRQIETRMCW